MAELTADHALVLTVFDALDAQHEAQDLSYVDALRALQAALIVWLAHAVPEEYTPTVDAAIRGAIARFDPHNDDHLQESATLVHRLQVAVDTELSRWASAMVQPVGPSGDRAVPAPPPEMTA